MARPRCPQHPASRVWFDGTYGAAGRKRQRLHCVDGSHVFTEPLPRQKTDHRDCVECERSLAQHEGPSAPREQLYTVREVTRALMRVGEGWTYRGVGRLLRTDANRMKKTATGIEYASRDSSVVEDWIEIFAPVIFGRYAPKEWPPLVMLDDLPFLVRVPRTSHKRVAFRVFAALGFWPNGRRRLLRLEAFADKTPANWAQFLTAIAGRPCGIICDNESGMLKGIEQVWLHTAAHPAATRGSRHRCRTRSRTPLWARPNGRRSTRSPGSRTSRSW